MRVSSDTGTTVEVSMFSLMLARTAEVPDVSVVLCHWKTPVLTRSAIHVAETSFNQNSVEVIVVDNASSPANSVPDTFDSRCRVIRMMDNVGFARAANLGAKIARGRFLLFLNSDCFLLGDSGDAMVAALTEDCRLAVVGATTIESGDRRIIAAPALLTPFNHALGLLGASARARRILADACPKSVPYRFVPWVPAAALLVRREPFQEVGGFDESFIFYEEDEDFCWRLRRRGYEVGVSINATAQHEGGASSRLVQDWADKALCRAQARFCYKRGGWAAALSYGAMLTLVVAAKALSRRPSSLSAGCYDLLKTFWSGVPNSLPLPE